MPTTRPSMLTTLAADARKPRAGRTRRGAYLAAELPVGAKAVKDSGAKLD